MRRLPVCALALTLVAAVPANAGTNDLTIAEYLAAWDRIDAREISKEVETTGTFDPDRHPAFASAINRMREIALAYRERIKAERAAGQTPHSCLPDGKTEITSDVLIAHLRSYAAGQQAATMLGQAFADLMAKTYPCP
jgi:hypothetical protein